MKKRLVIDTDAGIDDAIAIWMALADPAVELVAITAVSGNVPVDQVVRNIGIVLDLAGAGPIPFFRGASQPLVGPPVHAMDIHGQDGLGNAGFPPSSRHPEPGPAPWALVELARRFPGELFLVALGPLTNVALALAIEPDLPRL
ncbi:MAG: nucleoside hydrolase, partial [Anaerolineae bacterium]|uniref:nucleoside hydrolase n=1 Tax=Thermoflexus sp. TaxID=1969742 RepID=UPI0025CEBA38